LPLRQSDEEAIIGKEEEDRGYEIERNEGEI
jgi:hypothetical protein